LRSACVNGSKFNILIAQINGPRRATAGATMQDAATKAPGWRVFSRKIAIAIAEAGAPAPTSPL